MNIFSTLKQSAVSFLDTQQSKGPATYAAAKQALGAVLITDGFVGIENPFGSKKRSGIFGALVGVVFGVIFMFIPTFFGNLTGINNMTAMVSATVVSVGPASYGESNSGPACSLIVNYLVNGQEYTQSSSFSSSANCSLSPGQVITINYNPTSPGSWGYGTKTINAFLKVFFWVGLLVVISNIITFFIRLFSIIFGWKLLRSGRRDAANLPAGTNIQTMVNEIKQNFLSTALN